jgi:hypothetical protein
LICQSDFWPARYRKSAVEKRRIRLWFIAEPVVAEIVEEITKLGDWRIFSARA